ncbi:MAG: S9 family peptidase, partial [Bacteroidota bacterium]
MKRILHGIVAACVTGLLAGQAFAQTVPPTPNEDDIPRPVDAESSLAGADRPDIGRFLRVRSAGAPSVSPDGRRVAFRTDITGEPQVWVVASDGGWPHQITFGEPVTFHAWSPAGDWILYGVDRAGNEREGYYLISPDGTEEREILPPSDAFRVFGAFTRDGRKIVYATTSEQRPAFDIHTHDLETGEDRRVMEGRMGLYATAFSPTGDYVILTEARGEDANDVHLLNVQSGEAETLFAPSDRASYQSFSWTPDGRSFYLATNHDRGFAALARFDLADRSLHWIEEPNHDVSGVQLSPSGRYLAWTANVGGYSKLHVLDLQDDDRIEAPTLPHGIYGVTWASEAPVAAISVAGPQLPGDVWTWNVASGALHRATHSDAAGLNLSEMVIPESHFFPARDGVTLHGLLYLPPGLQAGERPPVLISLHGGPTSQARPRFNAAHQYLLTRGIAVFDLNYRGSSGFGKQFARLNDQRLREDEIYDL